PLPYAPSWPAPEVVAARLNRLFELITPPGANAGQEYTAEQVSQELAAKGEDVPAHVIQDARDGKATPPPSTIQALAKFFDMPATYFYDDNVATAMDKDLETLALLRDHNIRNIAMRAAGLSDASLKPIVDLIENTRRLEGLPPTDDSD
ncbi:hypothetical protein, partial [Nocardiopsis rhodophaea]